VVGGKRRRFRRLKLSRFKSRRPRRAGEESLLGGLLSRAAKLTNFVVFKPVKASARFVGKVAASPFTGVKKCAAPPGDSDLTYKQRKAQRREEKAARREEKKAKARPLRDSRDGRDP